MLVLIALILARIGLLRGVGCWRVLIVPFFGIWIPAGNGGCGVVWISV
jgi:hypothetical protein